MLTIGISLDQSRGRRATPPDPEPTWSPLDLFTGGYLGRLYDFKKSRMWTDDGVTLANVGQSVQRIEDLTGVGDASQGNSSSRAVLQADGSVSLDGLDDFYYTDIAPGAGPYSVVACFELGASMASNKRFAASATSGTTANRVLLNVDGSVRASATFNASSTAYADGNVSNTKTSIGVRKGATSFRAVINGLPVGAGNTAVTSNVATLFTIGGEATTGWIKGKLLGFLYINREMTDEEFADLHQYWSA